MAELFENIPLKRKDGTIVMENDLKDKIIGLYFSAQWCGSCCGFAEILKEFYKELSSTNYFEIIFLSSDDSVKDMEEYMIECHENWLYVPFGHPIVEILSEKYNAQGIPILVIINPNGKVIENDADEDVRKKSPKLALEKWKKQM